MVRFDIKIIANSYQKINLYYVKFYITNWYVETLWVFENCDTIKYLQFERQKFCVGFYLNYFGKNLIGFFDCLFLRILLWCYKKCV